MTDDLVYKEIIANKGHYSMAHNMAHMIEMNDEDKYKVALAELISVLDSCPHYEAGAGSVGGMTIDAQIQRMFINGVPVTAVDKARDILSESF